MKILAVDDKGNLHKAESEAIVILFDWGYRVISRGGGFNDYCTDLERLLANPNVSQRHLEAVKAWLTNHK